MPRRRRTRTTLPATRTMETRAQTAHVVRRVRAGTGLSQSRFAARFGFSAAAVRDWEQGRRTPEASTLCYLRVIECEPQAVKRALGDDLIVAPRLPASSPRSALSRQGEGRTTPTSPLQREPDRCRLTPAASRSPDLKATPESPPPGAPCPGCPSPPRCRPPQSPASPSRAPATSRPGTRSSRPSPGRTIAPVRRAKVPVALHDVLADDVALPIQERRPSFTAWSRVNVDL